ncbi:hypothetical protein QMM42_03230 [Leptospira santarosai]|uniref:PF12822 family protein n=1 Tax=Leptospira santarosai serovar Arenal str. MAVJ 401 TaxID=1049976 RepID=M6JPR2_9LEPT|nr:DUF6580 family putative transport protein [Leptospira santarosai]EMM75362.1 hypothetical protein LEP1GSC040_3306 [Leptospira santarosai str. 2000030832]EMN23746.1 hypothetical protein LEP1GSC063_1482 [Leptospira santarosai serovar Arenal str. MAVJ 401]EMO84382.1 hypothetical protein LEP1GSC070_3163 [Leptospira santarosai str. AIM]MDI7185231.1 hypothetical protein [Leptospira santarosai]MDI7199272.1 hypothetical protein [Leptospira santarosai]
MQQPDPILTRIKSKLLTKHTISTLGVILSGISRLLPHPPNFTLVGAMTVYSGARIQGWKSFAYPTFTILITDFILSKIHGFDWFYEGLPLVYCSLLINVLLGRIFLKTDRKLISVFGVTLLASAQFFVLSNFSVWAFSSFYPKTSEGLLTCYIAAIPYFGGTLLGDLIYTSILFGILDRIELKANFTNSINETRKEELSV